MNLRDVTVYKEGDGQGHFRNCRAETTVRELNGILDMLSADESRHAEALRALQAGAKMELPHSSTLDGARRILRRLSLRSCGLATFGGELRSYLSAMDFESNTARACSQLASEADSGWKKELLLKIAAEDEIHFTLLEHMRETLLELDGRGQEHDGVIDDE